MTAARPWPLILALLLQGGVYLAWLTQGRFVLATLLVFVAPPLLLALSALGRWRHARYLSSVAALGWFSHGVMRAWTDHPDNAPAWAALLLALLIIALASGRSARARLASRRKPTAH